MRWVKEGNEVKKRVKYNNTIVTVSNRECDHCIGISGSEFLV